MFSLDGIRADGWFEGIRASSPEIERIIEIVGEMPFAFSIILGVHITAVSVDVRNRDASAVDFAVGDDTRTHRIALGEFRRRLASSLTDDSGPEEPLPEEPESEDIESFLGSQLLLLSALFGLSLRDLVLTENGPPRLRVDVGRTRDEITVAD
ncbi:MAG: hypothetical protein H5U40_06125, partial [Polyangiaceae bacterium]|nr:hypothetical protein [Polyangiaceae bacterium]